MAAALALATIPIERRRPLPPRSERWSRFSRHRSWSPVARTQSAPAGSVLAIVQPATIGSSRGGVPRAPRGRCHARRGRRQRRSPPSPAPTCAGAVRNVDITAATAGDRASVRRPGRRRPRWLLLPPQRRPCDPARVAPGRRHAPRLRACTEAGQTRQARTPTTSGSRRGCPDGSEWFVDAGLGDGPSDPLPLVFGTYEQSGFTYELGPSTFDPTGWRLGHDPRGAFIGADFAARPHGPSSSSRCTAKLSTEPASGFVRVVAIMRRTDDAVEILRGCVRSTITGSNDRERRRRLRRRTGGGS